MLPDIASEDLTRCARRLRPRVALLCAWLVLHAATLPGCISYKPAPLDQVSFKEHAVSEMQDGVRVTTAALGNKDAKKLFPVNLKKHGIQPVWLEVENGGDRSYTFFQQSIDPDYFAASEAAYKSHYSPTKRFLSYGVLGLLVWPLLLFAPVQFVSARIANKRMDAHFIENGVGNFVLAPDESISGFVFTHVDEGTKQVNVTLMSPRGTKQFDLFVDVVLIGPGVMRGDTVVVQVDGGERELPRRRLIAILPGVEEEKNRWRAKATLSFALRAGNTDQFDLVVDAYARRETPRTRLRLDYTNVLGTLEGVETKNMHRGTARFDYYRTHKLFFIPGYGDVFHDPYDIFLLEAWANTNYVVFEVPEPGPTSLAAAAFIVLAVLRSRRPR